MKENTLSIKAFIQASLFWYLVIFICYKNLLFRRVFGLSKTNSLIILTGIAIGVFVINFWISGKYARNEKSVYVTAILSYGIYAILTYCKYMKNIYIGIGVIFSVITIVYLGLVLCRKITNESARRRIIKIRKRKCYIGTRNIVAVACFLFLISAYVQTSIMGGVSQASEVKPTQLYGDEYSMENNMEMFLYLQPDEWEKIKGNIDLKLNILQTVINCEGRYLSFNKAITLHVDDLEDGVIAYYNHGDGSIYIDRAHLDDTSEEVLSYILHECYHCSQNQFSDIYRGLDVSDQNSYFMLEAAKYAAEIDNYVDAKEDLHGYYSQRLESDARAHSITSTKIIMDRIEEYVEEMR